MSDITDENTVSFTSSSIVLQCTYNSSGSRVWDKQHFCFFCEESSTKVSKHYLGPHKKEPEVQKILSFPLKSSQRKLQLLKLRNSEDYTHNLEVLKKGQGTFVTWTRKSDQNWSFNDFLPCEDCLGFFLKSTLWRHRKVCPLKKTKLITEGFNPKQHFSYHVLYMSIKDYN